MIHFWVNFSSLCAIKPIVPIHIFWCKILKDILKVGACDSKLKFKFFVIKSGLVDNVVYHHYWICMFMIVLNKMVPTLWPVFIFSLSMSSSSIPWIGKLLLVGSGWQQYSAALLVSSMKGRVLVVAWLIFFFVCGWEAEWAIFLAFHICTLLAWFKKSVVDWRYIRRTDEIDSKTDPND